MEKELDRNFPRLIKDTPGWEFFKEWYKNTISLEDKSWITPSMNSALGLNFHRFIQFPFEFQKGVFEEFMNSYNVLITQTHNFEQTGPVRTWTIWTEADSFISYKESVKDAILKFFRHYEKFNEDSVTTDSEHHLGI